MTIRLRRPRDRISPSASGRICQMTKCQASQYTAHAMGHKIDFHIRDDPWQFAQDIF